MGRLAFRSINLSPVRASSGGRIRFSTPLRTSISSRACARVVAPGLRPTPRSAIHTRLASRASSVRLHFVEPRLRQPDVDRTTTALSLTPQHRRAQLSPHCLSDAASATPFRFGWLLLLRLASTSLQPPLSGQSLRRFVVVMSSVCGQQTCRSRGISEFTGLSAELSVHPQLTATSSTVRRRCAPIAHRLVPYFPSRGFTVSRFVKRPALQAHGGMSR